MLSVSGALLDAKTRGVALGVNVAADENFVGWEDPLVVPAEMMFRRSLTS